MVLYPPSFLLGWLLGCLAWRASLCLGFVFFFFRNPLGFSYCYSVSLFVCLRFWFFPRSAPHDRVRCFPEADAREPTRSLRPTFQPCQRRSAAAAAIRQARPPPAAEARWQWQWQWQWQWWRWRAWRSRPLQPRQQQPSVRPDSTVHRQLSAEAFKGPAATGRRGDGATGRHGGHGWRGVARHAARCVDGRKLWSCGALCPRQGFEAACGAWLSDTTIS